MFLYRWSGYTQTLIFLLKHPQKANYWCFGFYHFLASLYLFGTIWNVYSSADKVFHVLKRLLSFLFWWITICESDLDLWFMMCDESKLNQRFHLHCQCTLECHSLTCHGQVAIVASLWLAQPLSVHLHLIFLSRLAFVLNQLSLSLPFWQLGPFSELIRSSRSPSERHLNGGRLTDSFSPLFLLCFYCIFLRSLPSSPLLLWAPLRPTLPLFN